MWTIPLPLAVAVSSRRDFTLNMNRYRNAHHHELARAKVEFERVVSPLLRGVPRLERCHLEYVYYHGSGRVPDTNNVCAVHDKFFADVMVGCGVLDDDGPDHLVATRFRYGGVDRENPRVDAVIRDADTSPLALPWPVTERKHHMKLTHLINVAKEDVQAALRSYIKQNFPHIDLTDDTEFNLTEDGSYEARMAVDHAPAGKKAGRAKLPPAEAMVALASAGKAAAGPGEPHKVVSEPEVPKHPQAALPAAPGPSPSPEPAPAQVAAASPEPVPQPRAGGLFAGFKRITNEGQPAH